MRKPDDPTASTERAANGEGGLSFYGRWSRRKHQARDGVVPPDDDVRPVSVKHEARPDNSPAQRGDEAQAADPGADVAAPGERVLTDADMPPLESLGENDDYSGFMSPGVSEALRNRALRKLFMSSQYNVVDGLDDYADDFTHFEPLGDIITSDMRHQMEMQAEREKREAAEKARAHLEEPSAGDEETRIAQQASEEEPVQAAGSGPDPDREPEAGADPDEAAADPDPLAGRMAEQPPQTIDSPEPAAGAATRPDDDPEDSRDV